MRSTRTALLLAALVLAACDDPATAPAPRPHLAGAADDAPATLVPGTVKYRDAGHHPATGRAGDATIATRALLDRRGTATVDVWAGAPDGSGPGVLARIQLKRFTPDGALRATTNHAVPDVRHVELSLLVVERGTPVQVQAHVRGVDGARTGVVTVDDVVWLRPDLAVLGVTAPPVALVGIPVHVVAVVAELNGDVGARADCVLEVDGVAVDSAVRAWVDAGGTVSCEFAHTFTTAGPHALRVRVAGADPGDWDVANDTAGAPLTVVAELPFTSWSAWADSGTTRSWSEHSWDLPYGGGTHEQWRSRTERMSLTQSASLEAYIRHPIGFPTQPLVDVQVSQATGGTTVHAAKYPALAAEDSSLSPSSSRWCVTRASAGAVVAQLQACSYRTGLTPDERWYTVLRYAWNAGDVTYYSIESHILQCMPGSSSGCWPRYPMFSSWGYNTPGHDVTGTLVPFGTRYLLEASFRSGAERYAVRAEVPLARTHTTAGTPLACTAYGWTTVPWSILGRGWLTTCDGYGTESWRLAGTASMPAP